MDAEAMRVSGIGKVMLYIKPEKSEFNKFFSADSSDSNCDDQVKVDWSKIATETYELAEECLEINYYGAKRMVDAFIHLLQLSDSPRIVNVSSSMGKLEVCRAGLFQ